MKKGDKLDTSLPRKNGKYSGKRQKLAVGLPYAQRLIVPVRDAIKHYVVINFSFLYLGLYLNLHLHT